MPYHLAEKKSMDKQQDFSTRNKMPVIKFAKYGPCKTIHC